MLFRSGKGCSATHLNSFLIGPLGELYKCWNELGDGELNVKLTVKAQHFSKSAIEKIEACGGKAEVI